MVKIRQNRARRPGTAACAPPGVCGTALQHSAGKKGPGGGMLCRREKRRLESEARAAGRGKALCPAAGRSARRRACACAVAPGLPHAPLFVLLTRRCPVCGCPLCVCAVVPGLPHASLFVLLTRRCPVWAYPLSACTEAGLPRPASSRLHGCSYMPGMVQCREKGAGGRRVLPPGETTA